MAAQNALTILGICFLFMHAVLLTVGVVESVTPYEKLTEDIKNLNNSLNPSLNSTPPSTNFIDAAIGGVRQTLAFAGLAGWALDFAYDMLGFLGYLVYGIFTTLQALGLPESIVFILGIIIAGVQAFGLLELVLIIVSTLAGTRGN